LVALSLESKSKKLLEEVQVYLAAQLLERQTPLLEQKLHLKVAKRPCLSPLQGACLVDKSFLRPLSQKKLSQLLPVFSELDLQSLPREAHFSATLTL
jgi:hypothetical protein